MINFSVVLLGLPTLG